MNETKTNLEIAKKAWNAARKITIDVITEFAKEHIGSIILFDDINCFTKLRYTEEKGAELWRGRGFRYWVSINADSNDFFSGAPTNSDLEYLLRTFMFHRYDVHTPSQDDKRIKKWTGRPNEYEYVDYDPNDYSREGLEELTELFFTNIKKCNVKREQHPSNKNYYCYELDFNEDKNLPFTWLNCGNYLVDDVTDGIIVVSWMDRNTEKPYYVSIKRGAFLHKIDLSSVNKTHAKQIANSLEEYFKK